jgi:hypothetical protein
VEQPQKAEQNPEIGGMAVMLLRLLTGHSRFGDLIKSPGSSRNINKLPVGDQTSLLAAVLLIPERNEEVCFCQFNLSILWDYHGCLFRFCGNTTEVSLILSDCQGVALRCAVIIRDCGCGHEAWAMELSMATPGPKCSPWSPKLPFEPLIAERDDVARFFQITFI